MEDIEITATEVVETKPTAVSVTAPTVQQVAGVDSFRDSASFEFAQRTAKLLAASTLVPEAYRNNIPNVMVAMNMAQRVGADPMAVMQNLNIIHGRPSWSSAFAIGVLNQCGRFTELQFIMSGTGEEAGCHIETTSTQTGAKIIGPRVTLKMAKAEGWEGKAGSKWKTMPELMLRYRAAAFFSRLYAADLLLGMQTVEEAQDISRQRGVALPEIYPGHEKWESMLAALAAGTTTIKGVKTRFSISPENEALITARP